MLGSSSIRSKKATQTLGRFQVSVHVRRSFHRHNQVVLSALMATLFMIMYEELVDGLASRLLAEENQPAQTFPFQ